MEVERSRGDLKSASSVKRKRCDEDYEYHKGGSHFTEKRRDSKHTKLNKLDPIMLTELTDNTFTFTRGNGKKVVYNVESLIDYFLFTGDFTEPETRLAFSDEDLKRLDFLAKEGGLAKDSVYEAKNSPQKYVEKKLKSDAILGLERVVGELVCEMMEVIECSDPEEGEMRLLVNIFPLFADLFKQLEDADAERAQQSINHWKHYLRGPRNRPTKDYYGFLPVILSFLDRSRSQDSSDSE